MKTDEPDTYTTQAAARTLGVALADIEAYVEEGLVVPRGGEGGRVVFTRVEMRRLWSIVTLHRDLGINLAGVAAVLRLREQFEQVRRDLLLLAELVERELGPDVWDRLWPEGRPRPGAHVSVEGVSEADGAPPPPDGAAPPPDSPADAPAGDAP